MINKKVAIVVGGANNLGAYLSENLEKNNYLTIVLDIDEKNGNLLSLKNENLVFYKADVNDKNQLKEVFKKIEMKYKNIDLLVYNTGFAYSKKIDEYPLDMFQKTIQLNLIGYFMCAKLASKMMIKNKKPGVVININSKSGKVGSKYNCAYSAAKFGAVGLTQSLALDLAEHNIRVISLMLGNLLDSPMFESLIPSYAKKLNIPIEEVKKHYIDKVPLKRGCSFSDVFNLLLFYASDKASYCTGQSINITGGQVMF